MSSTIPTAESLPTSAFHTFSLAAIRTFKAPSTSLAELTHANITLTTLGELLGTPPYPPYKVSLPRERLDMLNETQRKTASFSTITYEEVRRKQFQMLQVQVDLFKGDSPLPCLTEVHSCILTDKEFGLERITNVFIELVTDQPPSDRSARPISTKVRLSTSIREPQREHSVKTIYCTEGFRIMINDYRPRTPSTLLIGR